MTPHILTPLHMNRQQQVWHRAAPEELVRAHQMAQAPEAILLRRLAQAVARCDRHALIRARQIQRTEALVEALRALRPRTPARLRGWRIESAWEPAEGVGGDFYDLVPLADGRIGLLIGDVAGKGATAAIVMALVRPILRAEVATGATPAEVLRRVNAQISAVMPAGCFLTTLYAVLNPISGVMRVANAGHNQPLVRTLHGVERVDVTGFPLGLMDDVLYEEASLILKQGETLLLTTDGITDARNMQREHFGFARLQQVVAQWDGRSPGIVERLLDAVRTFAGDFEAQDDVAILALQRG